LTLKNFKSITLIGMPGSGKSTIGKLLTRQLGFTFMDTDKYIETQEKKSLQQILDDEGNEGFCKIEEKRILELLPLTNHVLAPGGSIIYSKKLMNALKNSAIIIFLDVPLLILEERLKDKNSRGIVGLKTKSLKVLYDERVPFYKKSADLMISCQGKSDDEIISEIIKRLEFF